MAAYSSIEWTETTWNPVTGCTKVSEGCRHCYAERLALRLQAMGNRNYANGFQVTLHEHMVDMPLQWKRPRIIFVNSMSDLFHDSVPVDFVSQVFETMAKCHWHVFQVLTKRSHRLKQLSGRLPWPSNVWMGVTVEDSTCVHRIADLKATGARVKFLSLEPLLGPMPTLELDGIDWVIVGGESGPRARLMDIRWVLDIREQCQAANVRFFFKQWGGTNKKKSGRLLEGRTWDDMPSNGCGSLHSVAGATRRLPAMGHYPEVGDFAEWVLRNPDLGTWPRDSGWQVNT